MPGGTNGWDIPEHRDDDDALAAAPGEGIAASSLLLAPSSPPACDALAALLSTSAVDPHVCCY